jgi:spermidine/putrescine transport system substrate-binding protein
MDDKRIAVQARDVLTRRDILKLGSVALGSLTSGGLVGGATLIAGSRSAAAQAAVVNMLAWQGHGGPEEVGPFEKEHGVRVRVTEYADGEQMLALATSATPGTYDVIMADAEYIEMLHKADLLERLDPADFPIDDFWPEFRRFESHWVEDELYAVMLRYGYIGMAYNTEQYSPSDMESYEILWDPKTTGRLGWWDWYLPSMGCISLHNGNRPPYDIDDAAFEAVKQRLFSLAPQGGRFLQVEGVLSSLARGETWVIPGVGDWAALLLQKEGHPIKLAIPKSGGLQWTVSLSIAKGSGNPEMAKKYIQYATSPEGQIRAATLKSHAASIPNVEGWKLMAERMPEWSDRLRHRLDGPNVMDELREGRIFLRDLPVQQGTADWKQAWDQFKTL